MEPINFTKKNIYKTYEYEVEYFLNEKKTIQTKLSVIAEILIYDSSLTYDQKGEFI